MRMFATISTFIARRLSTTDSAASSTTRPSTCDQVIQAALPASNVEPEEDAIVAKQTSRSAAGNHQEETNSGPHLDVQLIGFSAANNPPQNPHGKEVQPTGEELLNALDISETKRCILCQLPLDFTHATNPAVPSSNCLSETFDFHDLAADCVVGNLNKYRHNDDQDGSHSQNEQIDQAEAGQTVEDWRIGECLRIRIAPGDLLDEDTDESREKNRISVARILQLNIAFSVMQQLIERNKNPAPDCQPFNSSKPSNTIHNRKQSKFNATQKSQTVEYYSKILQERVKTPWMSKIIPRIMTENELESISLDMHYYCILLSSGLAQNGEEDEGLRGFLLPDIYREMRRGTHLKCKFCQHPGATIGCCVKSCSVKFHYPCGLSNQCLFQFFDHFLSFCPKHKPIQEFISKADFCTETFRADCPICMCDIEVQDAFQSPCCKQFFHLCCLKQQSLTSGKHQFKCPLCFNVDEFHKECLQFGCYIPDRDVKWSTYSNQELANSHNDESVDNSDQSMEETLEKQDSDCKLLSLASSKDFDQSNSPDLYASELLRLLDMDQLHHNMNLNLILKDSSLDNFDVVDQRPSKEKKTRFICNSFEDCFCSIDSRKYQECCNDHKTSTISNNHSCTTNNDNEEFELPDIPQ